MRGFVISQWIMDNNIKKEKLLIILRVDILALPLISFSQPVLLISFYPYASAFLRTPDPRDPTPHFVQIDSTSSYIRNLQC